MKSKRKKGSRKKGKGGKFLFLLILIGIIALVFYLFHQDIIHSLKPWLEKWSPVEKKKEVLLYFSDREGEYLIGEKREILKKNQINEEAKEMIIELINGPRGKLIPTLPPRTKLLTLQISDAGVAKVNFSLSLAKDHPGGSSAEIMTTYSIVNSLTLNFPKIKQIQILVEGKPIETIAGHLSLKQPISPNPSLIKKQ
jgi:spore germination protein GerM